MFGGVRNMKTDKNDNKNANKEMLTLQNKDEIAMILNKRVAEKNKDIELLEIEFANKINRLKNIK